MVWKAKNVESINKFNNFLTDWVLQNKNLEISSYKGIIFGFIKYKNVAYFNVHMYDPLQSIQSCH